MVTYVTPDFAGFKVHAQYSFGANTYEDEDKAEVYKEGKSSTDRYYGVAVSYDNGPASARLIVDSVNKASWVAKKDGTGTGKDVDDTVRVTLGGSYDFGMVKPFLSAAYFKDGKVGELSNGVGGNAGVYDGYGLVAGAAVPAFGGTFKATVGYLDAEEQNVDANAKDITRWIVGAGYEYSLSKRTKVYVDAGYGQDDIDNADKPSFYQAAAGLVHYF